MRGSDFLKLLGWPVAFVITAVTVTGLAYFFDIDGPLLLGLLFVFGCFPAAAVLAIAALVLLTVRRWKPAIICAAFSLAVVSTPFLMTAAAQTAQVAHFKLNQQNYLSQALATSGQNGQRLAALDWYARDSEFGYDMLVYDERDVILAPQNADARWREQASRIEKLKTGQLGSQQMCSLDKTDALDARPVGQHFYLVSCYVD